MALRTDHDWAVEHLNPFFEGFEEHLIAKGLAPQTVAYRLRAADTFGRWLVGSGRRFDSIDEQLIQDFVRDRDQKSYGGCPYQNLLGQLLFFLRMVHRIPPLPPATAPRAGAWDGLLESWSRYLVQDRGIAPASARIYTTFGRFFLARVAGKDLSGLGAKVTAESVTTFMVSRSAEVSGGHLEAEASHLRQLLGFLHSQGLVDDVGGVVPSVRSYRYGGVPKALSENEVRAITREMGASPGTRYRNLAILALLSGLGLRAGEVADLRLEDIAWRAGIIVVRGKGHYRDALPLPPGVGLALAEYLAHDTHRGPGERHVFHTAVGAFGPLRANGVKHTVSSAAARAGCGPIGPHRFRHALASRALNAGSSMEEVSQLLRHRSLESTGIYAKVDFERLRQVARPWPGPVTMSWLGAGS